MTVVAGETVGGTIADANGAGANTDTTTTPPAMGRNGFVTGGDTADIRYALFLKTLALGLHAAEYVDTATLKLNSDSAFFTGSETVTMRIRAYATTSPSVPTTYTGQIAASKTTAYTDVVLDSSSADTTVSVNVKDIVNELLDLSGWTTSTKALFSAEYVSHTGSGLSHYVLFSATHADHEVDYTLTSNSGELSATLGVMTLFAGGFPPPEEQGEGELSATFGVMRLVAFGGDVDTGALSQAFGTMTLTSEALLSRYPGGTLDRGTLGAMTLAGNGNLLIEGNTDATFGTMQVVGFGGLAIQGGLAVTTLGVMTASASGNLPNTGEVNATFGAMAVAAADFYPGWGQFPESPDDPREGGRNWVLQSQKFTPLCSMQLAAETTAFGVQCRVCIVPIAVPP